MTKVVLINGLFVHDSGKTWFSVSLAKNFINRGYNINIYKPVAGHSAWTQYFTVTRSKELKLLVGADVLTYLDLGLISNKELPNTNPVDLLTSPVDIAKYLNANMFNKYLTDAFDQFKQIVLARITSCEDGIVKHFIVRNNLNHTVSSLVNDLMELSNIMKAEDVNIDELIKILKSPWIESNLDLCLKKKCYGKDVVIVESFNDAFTPYYSLLDYVDIVISIGQGRAMLFDDLSDIKELIKERITTLGDEGLKSLNLVNKLTPSSIIEIPPKSNIASMSDIDWGPLIESIVT
ncbi:MAG: hypothetical protein QXZ10_01805 [Sulfolobales archaeon]